MKNLRMILFILLLFPINVYALTGSIDVSCTPSEVKAGENVTCVVTGNSDAVVTAISISYNLGTGASINSYNMDSAIWYQNEAENNVLEAIPKEDLSGKFTIGTFTVKIDSNASAGDIAFKFSKCVFYDSNDKANNVSDVNKTIKVVAASEAKTGLKNLASTVSIISPQFFSSNHSYTLVLPEKTTTFGLNATAINESDKIVVKNSDTDEVLDAKNITFKTVNGKNVMLITLLVGEGDSQAKYMVMVGKEVPASGKPTLSSLTVGDKNVYLNNDTSDSEEVSATVSNIDDYQVRAVLNDSNNYIFSDNNLNSACAINGNTLTCNMSGENSFPITIVSKNSGGLSKTYILSIKKGNDTTQEDPKPKPKPSTPDNPQTGSSAIVVGSVLIISLAISFFLYKKNIKGYN